MFSKILIANRGEIAVRIIRACKEMGIKTVAVYSEADKDTLHVQLADESVCIGPGQVTESYLREDRIISAAVATRAQAIHPGYGLLSENAGFARACKKNNIVFIGPSPELMEQISDKTVIKNMVKGTGLNPIPGTDVLSSVDEALEKAEEIGYPVMLKARSGGGGRGIRLITSADEMLKSYATAVSESEAAFDDGGMYIEKYVFPANHIEVQVIADEDGNVLCLGERDCSVQRHHQKLIEESPSPSVSEETRQKLYEAVTCGIKKIGYTGAGTLEFLLDKQGNFWFMEMNVRLQVEHGVTEMLTGVDLVKWQIRTAAGVPLIYKQEDISVKGTALECRINAKGLGMLNFIHVPGGPHVRFDTFLTPGTAITPYYDSLIGKLIVYSGTREEALRKMRATLCELVIDGIPNNIEEQLDIIGKKEFVSGTYDLTIVEDK